MTQRSHVGDEPFSVQAPIQISGPPGDWEALLLACALWVIALVGFGLGAAAFLTASRNADETRAFAEKAKQISAFMDQRTEIDERLAAISERLKQAERNGSGSVDWAGRQTELEQSLAHLRTTIDQAAAEGNEKSALSSTRLDKVEDEYSKMELRVAKVEESQVAIEKMVQRIAPTGSITSSATSPAQSAALANHPPDAAASAAASVDQEKTPYALSRYAIISVEKHSAKLSGPDGAVTVSMGDILPGGQKILKISSKHGKFRVVTDHGVIASKKPE